MVGNADSQAPPRPYQISLHLNHLVAFICTLNIEKVSATTFKSTITMSLAHISVITMCSFRVAGEISLHPQC